MKFKVSINPIHINAHITSCMTNYPSICSLRFLAALILIIVLMMCSIIGGWLYLGLPIYWCNQYGILVGQSSMPINETILYGFIDFIIDQTLHVCNICNELAMYTCIILLSCSLLVRLGINSWNIRCIKLELTVFVIVLY